MEYKRGDRIKLTPCGEDSKREYYINKIIPGFSQSGLTKLQLTEQGRFEELIETRLLDSFEEFWEGVENRFYVNPGKIKVTGESLELE